MNSRFNRATDAIVDSVEQEARERGIDETLASNLAVDISIQDQILEELCGTLDQLQRTTEISERRDDVSRSVSESAISAGIDLDDAIRARCEQLIEEIIAEAERQQIKQSTEAKA
jgi:hypothetical protein